MKFKTTFKELEEMGYPSVTDWCRKLVSQGDHREDTIEVYRGEMLCLTVTDIHEAAKIMPTDTGFKKFDKTKRGKKLGGVDKAPYSPVDAFK